MKKRHFGDHALEVLEEDGGWLEASLIRDRVKERMRRCPSIREMNAFLRKQKDLLETRMPEVGKTQIKQFRLKKRPEKKLPEKKLLNDFCEGER